MVRSHGELAELRSELRSIADQRPADFKVVLDIPGRSYDETPTKLRVRHEGKAIAKIMQTDTYWAFLLKVRVPLKDDYVLVRGKSYTSLHVVDKTTSECTRRVIELQCPTLYDSVAEKKVHLVATDGAGSNIRCEGAIVHEAPPRVAAARYRVASLRTACVVHRAQAVIKSTGALVPTLTSGVLNMSLSLRACGAMSLIRRIVKEVFAERFRVRRGAAPAALQARNRHIAQIFLARGKPK